MSTTKYLKTMTCENTRCPCILKDNSYIYLDLCWKPALYHTLNQFSAYNIIITPVTGLILNSVYWSAHSPLSA